jgi:hypothetical protein
MSEVHLNPIPGTTVVAHNPGQHPLPAGAGQPVVATGSVVNKTAVVRGQVPSSTVVIQNPA